MTEATFTNKVLNVVPADFNHDGKLDLLVMTEQRDGGWWGGEKVTVDMSVFLGASAGGFSEYQGVRRMVPKLKQVQRKIHGSWTRRQTPRRFCLMRMGL